MKLFYKSTSVIVNSILFSVSLNAHSLETPYDVNKVIERVQTQHSCKNLRNSEFIIDTTLVIVPATHSQFTAAAAFDGTNYFLVWMDQRSRDGWSNIYGSRVDQSGSVLDSAGIVISAAYESQDYPVVVFDGTNYFVVWTDGRRGSAYSDIYGARVSPNGQVLDTAGIAISVVSPNSQLRPAIAFNGTYYLVVWERYYSDQSEIFGARVAPSGIVVDTVAMNITNAVDYQRLPDISADGSNFLVVWADCRNDPGGDDYDIYGTRISSDGVILDSAGIPISTVTNSQGPPTLAFDGTNYFIVWHDWRNDTGGWTNCDIYGTFVDQSGSVLDSSGIVISDFNEIQRKPSITFNGINYLVAWMDARNSQNGYDIYGTRVSQTGVVIDTTGIPILMSEVDQWDIFVSHDNTNYLVVWNDNSNPVPGSDVYCARVDQTGSVLDTSGIVVSIAPNEQIIPAVAFNGTNYLVVWTDFHSNLSHWDIYGSRVDQSGATLDSIAIPVCDAQSNQLWPTVASGNADYLVVWHDYRAGSSYADIYATRVNQSGVVLDSTSIAVSTGADAEYYPTVAFDGTNYLVVWGDERNSWRDDIYGTRISSAGVILDSAGIPISTAQNDQYLPSITFDGTNYFVVWTDNRSSSSEDIYGTRVNLNGQVLDTAGIVIAYAVGDQSYPSVAFDGVNYLVVWQDLRSGNYCDIYGARVNQSGVVFDWIAITSDTNDQYYPSVAFNGTDYIVVWQNYSRTSGFYDILGAKVNVSGIVVDTFTVSTQWGHQKLPMPAHGTDDQVLIVYSGWADSINNHPVNMTRIWGKFYPFVGIKEDTELSGQFAKFGLQVYPNPVYKECEIKYILPKKTNVYISMFDVAGRLIKKNVYKNQNAGLYRKRFNVIDLAQGVYFIRFNAEEYSEIKKIILIK